MNETAEKRKNQILKKKVMETWRKIKYTIKQKKKMKINTASTGQDQFYFKIKFFFKKNLL